MNLRQFIQYTILSTVAVVPNLVYAEPPANFREAKKAMVKIFKHLNKPTTLYCGCSIEFPFRGGYKPDLRSCGYAIQKDEKRAERIEAEHIMSAWEFGHNLSCWTDAEIGEGRHDCEETSELFNKMESDLHNLYPAIGEVNKERSNYGFTEYLANRNTIEPFGRCEMYISPSDRLALPPKRSRGIIARAYLYMSYRYQLPIDKNHLELYYKWDREFPPDGNECKRNHLIEKVQGNSNPFMGKRCR